MIRTFLAACLGAFLAACVAEVPPEPTPDARLINVAIAAWEDAGRAYGQACEDTRHSIVVHETDAVLDYCNPDPNPDAIVNGCFVPPATDASPIIIATSDPSWRSDTIVSEALHWLSWCNTGDPDVNHEDYELWHVIKYQALASVPQ